MMLFNPYYLDPAVQSGSFLGILNTTQTKPNYMFSDIIKFALNEEIVNVDSQELEKASFTVSFEQADVQNINELQKSSIPNTAEYYKRLMGDSDETKIEKILELSSTSAPDVETTLSSSEVKNLIEELLNFSPAEFPHHAAHSFEKITGIEHLKKQLQNLDINNASNFVLAFNRADINPKIFEAADQQNITEVESKFSGLIDCLRTKSVNSENDNIILLISKSQVNLTENEELTRISTEGLINEEADGSDKKIIGDISPDVINEEGSKYDIKLFVGHIDELQPINAIKKSEMNKQISSEKTDLSKPNGDLLNKISGTVSNISSENPVSRNSVFIFNKNSASESQVVEGVNSTSESQVVEGVNSTSESQVVEGKNSAIEFNVVEGVNSASESPAIEVVNKETANSSSKESIVKSPTSDSIKQGGDTIVNGVICSKEGEIDLNDFIINKSNEKIHDKNNTVNLPEPEEENAVSHIKVKSTNPIKHKNSDTTQILKSENESRLKENSIKSKTIIINGITKSNDTKIEKSDSYPKDVKVSSQSYSNSYKGESVPGKLELENDLPANIQNTKSSLADKTNKSEILSTPPKLPDTMEVKETSTNIKINNTAVVYKDAKEEINSAKSLNSRMNIHGLDKNDVVEMRNQKDPTIIKSGNEILSSAFHKNEFKGIYKDQQPTSEIEVNVKYNDTASKSVIKDESNNEIQSKSNFGVNQKLSFEQMSEKQVDNDQLIRKPNLEKSGESSDNQYKSEEKNYGGGNKLVEKNDKISQVFENTISKEVDIQSEESIRTKERPNEKMASGNPNNAELDNTNEELKIGLSEELKHQVNKKAKTESSDNVKPNDELNAVRVNSQLNRTINFVKNYADVQHKVEVGRLLDEVANYMKEGDKKSITFSIDPENLGQVKVSIDSNNHMINAKIEVESIKVLQLFQSNSDLLKNVMMQSGIQLNSLHVSVSGQENKEEHFTKSRKKETGLNRSKVKIDKIPENFSPKDLGYNTYDYLI